MATMVPWIGEATTPAEPSVPSAPRPRPRRPVARVIEGLDEIVGG